MEFVKNAGIIIILSFALQVILVHKSFSQEEQPEKTYHFDGSISITNNGFSLIPTFSLGKPAAIADLSLGGKRFSFDPQLRFEIAGLKPWSIIFIWRYKLKQTDRWLIRAGLHLPAITFREETVQTNGTTIERLVSHRFMAPEILFNYSITKRINVGVYYLYGLGLERQDQPRHNHYFSLSAGFIQIPLNKQFYLNWNPQLYYLNIDGRDGIYVAHALAIGHRKIPFSLSTMMNVKLKSDVPSNDFDWNVSLVYTFRNQLAKK